MSPKWVLGCIMLASVVRSYSGLQARSAGACGRETPRQCRVQILSHILRFMPYASFYKLFHVSHILRCMRNIFYELFPVLSNCIVL
mmetsp:Transcript_5822/g.20297  ORF Transcript_5822/g.20297 Transcript_5822/m.20297 type:complete len:86 (+) Transcript_5822:953-1210(+)